METNKDRLAVKAANTDYPIIDQLKERWSPRVFGEQVPSEQELRQIFEAARWAASSMNEQPWRFMVTVKGTEAYQKVFDCLSGFNQMWVKSPVLVFAAYKKEFDSGKENFHALYDLGSAVAAMSIQAQDLGIAMHQMAGVDWRKAHEVFEVPEGYHVATALAIGYYTDEIASLPENLQQSETAPRTRKPQEDFVFTGNWGEGF